MFTPTYNRLSSKELERAIADENARIWLRHEFNTAAIIERNLAALRRAAGKPALRWEDLPKTPA